VQSPCDAPQSRAPLALNGMIGPGSAAHHHIASKTRVNALMVLRCVRGTRARSRGADRPSLASMCPSNKGGRRESRMPVAPAASHADEKSIRVSPPQVRRFTPAFPAQWFYGFLRALPGDLALLPPSHARRRLTHLTPALACQDHTTSPSALISLVWRHLRVHRIPRSTSVTTRDAPPIEAGWVAITTDQRLVKSKIFCTKGLDHPNQLETADELSLRAHAIFFAQNSAAIDATSQNRPTDLPVGQISQLTGPASIAKLHGARTPAAWGEHRPLDQVTAADDISVS
jgi:hypothetical protein